MARTHSADVGMDPRNLPVLCGYHLDKARSTYRLALRDSDERVHSVLHAPRGPLSPCAYCEALRLGQPLREGAEFSTAPTPDHVHEWVREEQEYLALGFHLNLGEKFCSMPYACAACHYRVSSDEVFSANSFLHDC